MKTLGLIAMTALLAGCAMGKSKFQCPTPNGAACKSVTEIYDMTDAAGETGLHAVSRTIRGEQPERDAARDGALVPPAAIAPPIVVVDPGDPFPVRTPAKVLRVLVTPWEDSSGNLHAGGYVFAEIETRKWMIGQPRATREQRVMKLQVESAIPGPNATAPGRESARTPNAKPSDGMSGGGG